MTKFTSTATKRQTTKQVLIELVKERKDGGSIFVPVRRDALLRFEKHARELSGKL